MWRRAVKATCDPDSLNSTVVVYYLCISTMMLSVLYSEPLWPIEARNAAIANHCFTCAINRVGTVSVLQPVCNQRS